MSKKNPLTPAGIEPPTFRFVAQLLNHCATAVPVILRQRFNIHYTVDNNTCESTIQMGNIIEFLWQQWESERAKTHTAYLIRITFFSLRQSQIILLLRLPVSLVLLFIEITHLSYFLPFFLPAAKAQSEFIQGPPENRAIWQRCFLYF